MVRLLAVETTKLVVTLMPCPIYTGMVMLNNSANIRHENLADFDRAPVECFMQYGAYNEMPINEPSEFLP